MVLEKPWQTVIVLPPHTFPERNCVSCCLHLFLLVFHNFCSTIFSVLFLSWIQKSKPHNTNALQSLQLCFQLVQHMLTTKNHGLQLANQGLCCSLVHQMDHGIPGTFKSAVPSRFYRADSFQQEPSDSKG